MAQPGWYPDPEGRPQHVRFWDGTAWQGPATTQAAAAASPPPVGGPPRNGWRRWLPYVALVVVVLVAIVVWSSIRSGTPVAVDTQSARPTGSVWNETVDPTPTPPTDPPTTSEDDGSTVECPVVENQRRDHPQDGLVHGGGLAFEVPRGWDAGGSWSRVLTDQAGAGRSFEDSSWSSLLTVGIAPHAKGFTEPWTTAYQILQCHVTSGRFSGYTGHTITADEAIEIEGRGGRRMRVHATSTEVPGGGATYDIVVIDLGDEEGLSVFWGGVIDSDRQALADLDTVRQSLRLG